MVILFLVGLWDLHLPRARAKPSHQLLKMTLCSCLSTLPGTARPSYESVSLRRVKMSEEARIPAQRSGFAFQGHTPQPVSTLTYLLSVWVPARGLECVCMCVCVYTCTWFSMCVFFIHTKPLLNIMRQNEHTTFTLHNHETYVEKRIKVNKRSEHSLLHARHSQSAQRVGGSPEE